ncbi:hypothetical protein KIPB_017122, partial [Kipferlia bialata]|eukprot:g17122.t1
MADQEMYGGESPAEPTMRQMPRVTSEEQ